MFVLLNTHHENRVLDLGAGDASSSTHAGNRFVTNIWRQVAERFRDYDERLIFTSLNEPRHEGGENEWDGGSVTVRDNVNRLNQAFVDVVRGTGGNNENRFLLVPTVAAGSNNTALNAFRVPRDIERHRTTVGSGTNVGQGNTNISSRKIMLAAHTYSPFNWAHDGRGSYPGPNEIRADLNRVQTRANALGVPVIVSEWGSTATGAGNPAETWAPTPGSVNVNSERVQHAEDYVREARARGMVPVWWDNGGFTGNNHVFGLIRRPPPHNISDDHQEIIAGMLRGLGSNVSIMENNRDVVPMAPTPESQAVVIAPINILSGEFTVGPNPVDRSSGSVAFFWNGRTVTSGNLSIYDASGNLVSRVSISDAGATLAVAHSARREIAAWDLRDRRGRVVCEGSYLVRGVLVGVDGSRERVSVVVGVRK